MRRAVQATVGDRRIPLIEWGLKVHEIDKRPPGQTVPLHILGARFTLALGLRPIGPAHTRLQAPLVGIRFERGIPDAPSGLIRIAYGAWAVIEMLPGVAAEVRKGAFVRLEELREKLIRAGVIEPAAAEPQREHEDVHDGGATAKRDPGLPPNQSDFAAPAASQTAGARSACICTSRSGATPRFTVS